MTLRCAYRGDLRHEYLILQWWQAIMAQGEMDTLLAPSLHGLQAFLEYFTQPERLRFAVDAQGIWFAFWVEPILAGASIGLWVRPAYRRTKANLDCLLRAFDWAFKQYAVLLSLTVQLPVAGQLARLGFSEWQNIPCLWPSHNGCYFQYQTRDNWAWTRQRYEGSIL